MDDSGVCVDDPYYTGEVCDEATQYFDWLYT
jgi:hypothetical protein